MFSHIVIAAGHQPGIGGDPGAVHGAETEAKDVIIQVDIAAEILVKNGIKVTVVPHTLNLYDQIKWVNQRYTTNNVLALEIHKNSSMQPAHGVEVFAYPGLNQRLATAHKLSSLLANKAGLLNRGGKARNFAWVREVKAPALLVENGFIQTGPTDSAGVIAYEKKLGSALAYAIMELIGKGVTMPAPEPPVIENNITLRIWERKTGKITEELTNKQFELKNAMFFPDGTIAYQYENFIGFLHIGGYGELISDSIRIDGGQLSDGSKPGLIMITANDYIVYGYN